MRTESIRDLKSKLNRIVGGLADDALTGRTSSLQRSLATARTARQPTAVYTDLRYGSRLEDAASLATRARMAAKSPGAVLAWARRRRKSGIRVASAMSSW